MESFNMNQSYDHQYSNQMNAQIYEASQFCPPTNIPWNISMMPWSVQSVGQEVMEFKGNTDSLKPPDLPKPNLHCKRKSSITDPIPTKQLITEEKMIDYMNGLHISKDYTSHTSASDGAASCSSSTSNQDAFNEASSALNTIITMKQIELEKKLRNAQSITICDEIKSLGSDSIIPKILLERMEKPCTALVVWQPPKSLKNVYETIRTNINEATAPASNSRTSMYSTSGGGHRDNEKLGNIKIDDEDDEIDDDDTIEDGVFCDFDNNNSTALDLNNCMDLDG